MKVKYFRDTDTLYIEFQSQEIVADSTGQRNTLLSLSEMRSVAACPENHGFITPKQTRQ